MNLFKLIIKFKIICAVAAPDIKWFSIQVEGMCHLEVFSSHRLLHRAISDPFQRDISDTQSISDKFVFPGTEMCLVITSFFHGQGATLNQHFHAP